MYNVSGNQIPHVQLLYLENEYWKSFSQIVTQICHSKDLFLKNSKNTRSKDITMLRRTWCAERTSSMQLTFILWGNEAVDLRDVASPRRLVELLLHGQHCRGGGEKRKKEKQYMYIYQIF